MKKRKGADFIEDALADESRICGSGDINGEITLRVRGDDDQDLFGYGIGRALA